MKAWIAFCLIFLAVIAAVCFIKFYSLLFAIVISFTTLQMAEGHSRKGGAAY
jgi:hypothetical protein